MLILQLDKKLANKGLADKDLRDFMLISFKNRRSGSVLVIAIAIFVALLAVLGGFLKSTTQRQYATKKLNKVLMAREFSNSIAVLATHKLRDSELKNSTSSFLTELKKPLKDMAAMAKGNITEADLQALYGNLVTDLKQANSELGSLSFKANWSCAKEDFKPLLEAYPREKDGIIKIFVEVSYTPPASKEKITESYLYSVKVKITANLIPVLSKFTLYMEDALAGEPEERFNTIRTDSRGHMLNGNEYRPWILKNGPNITVTTYKSFAEEAYGLVYLGNPNASGGAKNINLGLSRSWNEPGECSEGFHFLANGRGDGLYTVEKLDGIYQMNWEIGLADDKDGEALFWYDLVRNGFHEKSRFSSMLKLYGAEQDSVSPTLVLGSVKARSLCARAYKGVLENHVEYGPLPYIDNELAFINYSGVTGVESDEDFSFKPFSTSYKNQHGRDLTFDVYKEKYNSVLWEFPYNRSLLYMATNYQDRHPENSGVIAKTDELFKFATGGSLDQNLMTKVPEPFHKIYNVDTLEKMNQFLDYEKTFLNGARISHIIDLTKENGANLIDELKKRHLLDERELKLNLNGWIYVKSKGPISISEKSLTITSHGGIVLENGDIQIKAPITTDGGYILQLVALNGNIDVEASGDLNVALTAASNSGSDKGQVKLIGKPTSSRVKILGNVAVKHIKSVKDHMARGLKIEYNPSLAALPNNMNEDNNEEDLLMFALDEVASLVE